jgi:hypothetical protein
MGYRRLPKGSVRTGYERSLAIRLCIPVFWVRKTNLRWADQSLAWAAP